MSIKDVTENKDFFIAESRKEVLIESGGKKLLFYANQISYLENQNIGVQASARGKNGLALLVAESITDKDGHKFTYDEVIRLREEFAKPFFDAALEVNARGQDEKK